MNIKFSLLCPSRGRHNLLKNLIDSLKKTVSDPNIIELLIVIDNDDLDTEKFLEQTNYKNEPFKIKIFKRERSEYSNRDYYNWLAQFSEGKYLWILGNDLVFKVKNWDFIIEKKIDDYLKNKPDRIACFGAKDNTPKPDIKQPPFPCFPIVTREAFEELKFILHPEIKTWGADEALYELYTPIERYLPIDTDDLGNDVVYLDHISYHTKLIAEDEFAVRVGKIFRDSPSYNTSNYVISYIIPRQVAKLRGRIKDLKGRERPHILIVTERWCDYKEEVGLSNGEHNIIGSLQASRLATIDVIYHDYYMKRYQHSCDLAIVQRCIDSKPDMVFYSRCYENTVNCCPKWETFGIVKNILKIPIITIWWEAFDDIQKYDEYIDLNVVLQSVYTKDPNIDKTKTILMWTPQDSRIYNNSDENNRNKKNRDINISFVGSVAMPHCTDRRSGIDTLRSNGIDIYVNGGQREHKLSVEEYASIFKRSKISVNFAGAGTNIYHAKGRIFESTLCGSMLLESENPETSLWFEPNIDYIPFKDNEDLVRKARFYIEHEKERLEIVKNGYEKVTEKYNDKKFWVTIFDKIGIGKK